LALAPLVARAAPGDGPEPSLALRWSDPGQISPTTERDFDAQLSQRLGRPAFDASAGPRALSVSWLGKPEQCRVELTLTRGEAVDGTRVIESPSGDCRSLLPALLTVAALLVESHEGAEAAAAAEAAPPETAPTAPRPAEPAPSSPALPPSAPPSNWPRFLVSVGGSVSTGFVPKLELGPAAVVTWAPLSWLRVGVEGSVFLGRDYGEGPGVSLAHERGALLVCGMPVSGAFGLGACAQGGLHWFQSTGTSLPRPEERSMTTFSVGGELRAEWRLTRRLWWLGHVGGDVTTRPLYFYYVTAEGEPRTVFQQRRSSPFLLVALSLEIP
jgi:hypothetical protein